MIMRYLSVCVCLFIAIPFANGQVFVGYDDFCGLPVVVGNDPQSATARKDQYGNKFIHVDPSVMSNWSSSRKFTLAHECAHHLLGHTNPLGEMQRYYGGTAAQELEADCWAARALLNSGNVQDITRTLVERASQGHFSQGGYPSGYERAQNIDNCISPTRECRIVQVLEEYTDFESVIQQTQIPCQHCSCDFFGNCGCVHAFDYAPQQIQVPVVRTHYVPRRVCD